MPEPVGICLKGRRDELGPSLELAPDVVYVGRRCTMGGWRLPESPYANPFRAKDVGGAEHAVTLYAQWLRHQRPDLVERARVELAGKRLACFCALGDPCHRSVLARVVAGGEP